LGLPDGALVERLFGASADQWNSWRWQYRHAIRTPRALHELLSHPLLRGNPRTALSEDIWRVIHDSHASYRMNVSPFNLFLIVRSALAGGDHITRHPLWVLLLPNERESGDGIEWPRSEPSPQKGLLSFYGCTVDLVVTSACPVNCRMCTRRNVKFPGVAAESLEAAIEYIAGHATVRQVVLTGGDALMLDNGRLFRIIDRLRQVEHLHSIRIATRALAAVPMRISHDPELLAMLQSRSRTRPVTFVHTFFAHPDELTPECRAAVAALQSVGVVVYNSTVLSRGINDSYPVLSRMVADLCEMRVVNHHLFQCDVGQGLEGFWVPLDRAHQLYRRLYLEWPHSMGGPRDLMTTIAGEGRITFPVGLDLDAVAVEVEGEEFVRMVVDVTGNTVRYPRTEAAHRLYRRDPFRFVENGSRPVVVNPGWARPRPADARHGK